MSFEIHEWAAIRFNEMEIKSGLDKFYRQQGLESKLKEKTWKRLADDSYFRSISKRLLSFCNIH